MSTFDFQVYSVFIAHMSVELCNLPSKVVDGIGETAVLLLEFDAVEKKKKEERKELVCIPRLKSAKAE